MKDLRGKIEEIIENLCCHPNSRSCGCDYSGTTDALMKLLLSDRKAMREFVMAALPEKIKEQKDIRRYWFCEKCNHLDFEVMKSNSVYYCRDCGKKLVIREIGDEVYEPETDGWNSARQVALEAVGRYGDGEV